MTFNIGDHCIGEGRTYVIAEIGNNHNGNFDLAIEMIDSSIEIGVDCVKFQMRHLDQVYRKKTLSSASEDLGTEYVLDLLNKFQLTVEQHKRLFDYCRKRGVEYMCTPWDERSASVLHGFGVNAFKVASADLTNTLLLTHLVRYEKPLIISTGMSEREEIEMAVKFLLNQRAKFAVLHCNSTYPAPLHDIKLDFISHLRGLHGLVGYSGHERGINVSLAAVGIGACIIERHLTLDRSMEGPDHAASLTKDEFKKLVEGVREIDLAKGGSSQRVMSQGEMINRENLGKSLVAAYKLSRGHVIREADIKVLSPGQGLSPQKMVQLIGVKLRRDMDEEDFFYPSDLNAETTKERRYGFRRPWGIPVRYHDFVMFRELVKPDFWEFHLSYKDLDLNPADFLDSSYPESFVVHAPELLSNSRLMDLTSTDTHYLDFSIREAQRVVDITRNLKRFFPNSERPKIVVNIGGFSMDSPLNEDEVWARYEIFAKSLSKLDLDGVEFLPQTMAPYPWHFGGQRYQNMFILMDQIEYWCGKLGLRICFDVSHSKLAANNFDFDFYEFASRVSCFTAHLHLGDARELNGEGLQIGDGDIDFQRLMNILDEKCPSASFIPEIWQGHKDAGAGFWQALEALENLGAGRKMVTELSKIN